MLVIQHEHGIKGTRATILVERGYRKSSIKRRGAYSKLNFLMRRLTEGGAYSKAKGFRQKIFEPDENLKLVGHVPIECSSLLDYFLKADSWSFQESSYAVQNNFVKLTSYIVMEKKLNIVI